MNCRKGMKSAVFFNYFKKICKKLTKDIAKSLKV